MEGHQRLIVYEFMARGSLENHLFSMLNMVRVSHLCHLIGFLLFLYISSFFVVQGPWFFRGARG